MNVERRTPHICAWCMVYDNMYETQMNRFVIQFRERNSTKQPADKHNIQSVSKTERKNEENYFIEYYVNKQNCESNNYRYY